MKKRQELTFNKEFEKEMRILLGDEFELFEASFFNQRQKSIRLHPVKFKKAQFDRMEEFNFVDTGLNNNTYFVDVVQPLGQFPYFHAGAYYPQEASASVVVNVMKLKEDDIVLDLCAAPGGKSTQIVSQIPQGVCVSNEIDYKRAQVLKENLLRWGYPNSIVLNETPLRLTNEFDSCFDHILIDAPCSGEGMIKRFPELVSQFSMKKIMKLQKLQIELIQQSIKMIKYKGTITYSTCTFNRYENEMVIESILQSYPECSLVHLELQPYSVRGYQEIGQSCLRYYPHIFGEGHFIAQIQVNKTKSNQLKRESKTVKIKDEEFKGLNLINLRDLNVLCYGDPISLNSKVHWATPLQIEAKNDIELTIEEAYRYLNGQVLNLPGYSDFKTVGLDGLGLGWVKGDLEVLKNHYPKAFRNRFETMK